MNGATGMRRAGTWLTLVLSAVGMLILGPPAANAVVGGAPVGVEQVPWQALVIVEPDNRLCGGAIIGETWIATAAHCVVGFGGDDIEAHVGISSLSERGLANRVQIAEVIVHPDWEPRNFRNDIALLRLDTPIPTSARAQSISLPVGLDAATWPPAGTPAAISGWGATEFGGQPSNQLRRADVQILGGPSDAECGRYGTNFEAAVEICAGSPAGGVDACQGDSGSPLVVGVSGTPMLAGLTSVGFECARVDYPGIYTRVTSFVPWVQTYLPAAASIPSIPTNVTVEALAGERLLVQWQAPLVGVQPISYRVDVQPGGQQCQVAASELACVIGDVPAGRLYEVVVTSLLPTPTEISAEPVPVVSVDGVAAVGKLVKPRRLATWAGLTVRSKDVVRLSVPPRSRAVCDRVGSVTRPRGVRTSDPGVCAVRVRVVRPNGVSKRSVSYVGVRTG
jgi:hypothetical protein